MVRTRNKPLMVYLEGILFILVQEAILIPNPDLSASTYVRNLIFADLRSRNLLSQEALDSLITGEPLAIQSSK